MFSGTGDSMIRAIKLAAAMVMWTLALALAAVRTFDREEPLAVWSVLAALLALMCSVWLSFDLVVDQAARKVVEEIEAELDVVAERVATKITAALRDDGGNVSSLR